MKRIYLAQNPIMANLLKGILESRGIKATVQGEFLWSVRGETPAGPDTWPSVWIVDDSDYEKAMEIVVGFESEKAPDDSEGREWRCDNCGEDNEGQFAGCWNCGTDHN